MRNNLHASKLSGFWFQRAVRPTLPRLTLFSASSFNTTSPNFLFLLLLLPPSPILVELIPPLSSIFLERLGHPSFFHLNGIYASRYLSSRNTCSMPPPFPKCVSQLWQIRHHWAESPLTDDTLYSASLPHTSSEMCPGSGSKIKVIWQPGSIFPHLCVRLKLYVGLQVLEKNQELQQDVSKGYKVKKTTF